MTEAKHTPGPWKACKQFPHQSFIEIEHGDKHTPGAASLVIARVTCRPTWQEEQEANARLIAASPMLYDFCAKKAADGDDDAKSMLSSLGLID